MSLAAVIERSRCEKENWRYTPLEKLIVQDNALPRQNGGGLKKPKPPCRALLATLRLRHQIVFVNGVWNPKLSRLGQLPPGVIESGSNDEYNLVLEQQTCLITTPIELIFVTQKGAIETNARLNITIGPNARLTIIEHHVGDSVDTSAQIIETDIRLGAQSKLVHGKILHDQPNADASGAHASDGLRRRLLPQFRAHQGHAAGA